MHSDGRSQTVANRQKQSFVQNGYGTEKKEDRDKKGGISGKYIRPL
ncbi:UNVERIFIED_ORG: hypothetical protein J3D59_004711 [Pseudomonas fluorescens]